MRRYTESVASAVTGLPVPNAQIRVLNSDGSAAQLYSDDGVTALTQPVLTDGTGQFYFYVSDGTYSLQVSYPGSPTKTIPGVEIFSDAEANPLAERAVLVPVGETPPVLPDVATRAGKFLWFNDQGQAFAADAGGDSAYQVWLNQGNSGTVNDFLNAIRGPIGPQGIPGSQGDPGSPGTGLTPKGAWVTGTTYTASDYVTDTDGAGGTALYIAKGAPGHTFVSSTAPKDDPTNWTKLSAPAGPPGPAGSDANVNSTNIAAALGYTPVNPTQLGLKADKSLAGIAAACGFTPADAGLEVPRYNIEHWRQAGWTDNQTVQAAINGVNSLGGGILSAAGATTYVIDSIQLKPNVALDGINMKGTTNSNYILNLPAGTDNVTIRNCYFDGTAMSQGASGSCGITSPAGQNSFNFHVLNNRFKMAPMPNSPNPRSAHAWVMNSVWGVFSGNYCDQSGGDIYNFNGGFVIVTNNIAMNGGDGGVALNNGVSGICANNYISNTSLGVGIGPNSTGAYLLVIGNIIENCSIGVAPGSYGGTAPHHLKIDGNSIRGCGEAGISYNGESTSAEVNCSITNNLVFDAGYNWTGGPASGGKSGIIVNNGRGTHVSGNHVVNCSGFAYYFSGSNDITFSGNTARICGYPVLWIPTLGNNSAHLGPFFSTNNTNSVSSNPYPQTVISGEILYTGTTDSSGNALIAHGLGGVPNIKRIVGVSGFAISSGNALIPANVTFIDGTSISINTGTNFQPSRPYAITVKLKADANPNM